VYLIVWGIEKETGCNRQKPDMMPVTIPSTAACAAVWRVAAIALFVLVLENKNRAAAEPMNKVREEDQ